MSFGSCLDIFNDEQHKIAILAAETPKEQKSLGRSVENFDTDKWTSVCYEFMKEGLIGKVDIEMLLIHNLQFSQNDELKTQLLSTEDKILVEASPRDKIWGIGEEIYLQYMILLFHFCCSRNGKIQPRRRKS
jgi:ribA/ribD-fused uncharacterized protein